jgi:hypothetical protein
MELLLMTWSSEAWAVMRELARSGAPFSADDLRDRVWEPDPDHTPNGANNTIGSIFRQAAAQGLIELTGQVVKSRSPHRKGGMIQLWRGVPPLTLFDVDSPRAVMDTGPL